MIITMIQLHDRYQLHFYRSKRCMVIIVSHKRQNLNIIKYLKMSLTKNFSYNDEETAKCVNWGMIFLLDHFDLFRYCRKALSAIWRSVWFSFTQNTFGVYCCFNWLIVCGIIIGDNNIYLGVLACKISDA